MLVLIREAGYNRAIYRTSFWLKLYVNDGAP